MNSKNSGKTVEELLEQAERCNYDPESFFTCTTSLTIEELLQLENLCDRQPQLASLVVEGFLQAIENYQQRQGDFGPNENQRSVYRMAVLGIIRNFFSHPAFIETLASVDPDARVTAALLEAPGVNTNRCKTYRVKSPFCCDHYTHKFVDEWFAEQRYTIGAYGSIVVQLPSITKPQTPPNWFHKCIGWCFARGWMTDMAILIVLLMGWYLPWFGGVYFWAFVGALGIWGSLWWTRGAHVLKAMVPRLAACVIVGLGPLMTTRDPWKFSFYLWEYNWPLFLVVVGLLVFGSWLYLFVETHNHVGKACLSACRAFHILLRLCNFALFFSWWATTAICTSELPFGCSSGLPGKSPGSFAIVLLFVPLLGSWQVSVPLPPSLLFAVLAVFIGIFLQILWHDKPITSRL
jgi:uncharacterized integral membrane protein